MKNHLKTILVFVIVFGLGYLIVEYRDSMAIIFMVTFTVIMAVVCYVAVYGMVNDDLFK